MNHSPLAPCPSCQRHVRSDTAVCPFCAAPVAISPASVVPAATTTLGRAAAFTFATTLALGCASTQPTPVEPAPMVTPAPVTPAPVEPAPVTPAPVADPADAGPPPLADAAADVPVRDVTPPVRPTRPSGSSVGVRYGAPPRPEQ